jgi:hypothetical protein
LVTEEVDAFAVTLVEVSVEGEVVAGRLEG